MTYASMRSAQPTMRTLLLRSCPAWRRSGLTTNCARSPTRRSRASFAGPASASQWASNAALGVATRFWPQPHRSPRELDSRQPRVCVFVSVYMHDEWVKHRSSDRFFRNMQTIFSSGVALNLREELSFVTMTAVFVVVANCFITGYTGLDGVQHGALLTFFPGPLSLPPLPFSVAMPALSLLLGAPPPCISHASSQYLLYASPCPSSSRSFTSHPLSSPPAFTALSPPIDCTLCSLVLSSCSRLPRSSLPHKHRLRSMERGAHALGRCRQYMPERRSPEQRLLPRHAARRRAARAHGG